MTNQETVHVTVWHLEERFGGHEEGGWTYTVGEPVETVAVRCCMAESDGFELGVKVDHGDGDWGVNNRYWVHDESCPARGAYTGFHNAYVANHKEQYLRSYITANGTYDPDGSEDAPEDVIGEVATSGKYYVQFDRESPDTARNWWIREGDPIPFYE